MLKKISVAFTLLSCALFSCEQEMDHVVKIQTQYGEMTAILYDETPKHKENFLKLVREHYYDSLLFHRVINGFMIQGGDPQSKNAKPEQRLGEGGPGYTIQAEINPTLIHEKGALSAARLPDAVNPGKESSGSQFYIVHGTRQTEEELKLDQEKFGRALQQFFLDPENRAYFDSLDAFFQSGDEEGYQRFMQRIKPVIREKVGTSLDKDLSPAVVKAYTTIGGTPQLDGEYTVFGKVIDGLEVIDKIVAVDKGPFDRPVEDVRMKITVEEMPKRKIEKQYGYEYPEKD